MIGLDRLSARMGLNYMDLFAKVEVYNRKTDSEEPKRIKEIFTETEETFLACVALEYLRKHGVTTPGQLSAKGKTHIECSRCGHNILITEELAYG